MMVSPRPAKPCCMARNRSGLTGRCEMIRKTLLAAAASFMTLVAFSGTYLTMSWDSGSGTYLV